MGKMYVGPPLGCSAKLTTPPLAGLPDCEGKLPYWPFSPDAPADDDPRLPARPSASMLDAAATVPHLRTVLIVPMAPPSDSRHQQRPLSPIVCRWVHRKHHIPVTQLPLGEIRAFCP